MNILLIEDNQTIIKGLKYSFEKNNYNLIYRTNIKDAKELLNDNHKLDLIILDITLPDGNGFELFENNIKILNIPTIFLTAKDDEDDIVECLNAGAEDYITKPFSTKELLARIKAVLRRNDVSDLVNNNTKEEDKIYKCGKLKIDYDRHEVYCNNKLVTMTYKEIIHKVSEDTGIPVE